MNHIWVIEMKVDGRWVLAYDFSRTRKLARETAREWKKADNKIKLRVRKYISDGRKA